MKRDVGAIAFDDLIDESVLELPAAQPEKGWRRSGAGADLKVVAPPKAEARDFW